MKKMYLCLLMLLNITIMINSQTKEKENVTCSEASQIIQKHIGDTSFVILDVRTPEEYKDGHIEKSILINFNSPDFKENIIKLNKEKEYLVYCRKGGRSAEAVRIMKELGFKKLDHLFEGFLEWAGQGYKSVK